AGGIGQELAHGLGREQAILILVDLDLQALERVASPLRAAGVTVHCRALDVSRRTEVQALAAWIEQELGAAHVRIKNAGTGHSAEVAETSLERWEQLFAVNFWGPLYLIQALLPAMRRAGRGYVVNVVSGQVFFRLPTWGPYAATKAALG